MAKVQKQVKKIQEPVQEQVQQQIKPAPRRVFLERRQIFNLILFATLITIVAAFMILTALAKVNPYFKIDLIITKYIQQYRYLEWFDLLMRTVSFIGEPIPGTITIIGFTLLLLLGNLKKDALQLLISSVGLTLIGIGIKTFVARPRPDSNLIIQIGHYARHDSFPSGHVLHFIGLYGFLFYLLFTKYQRTLSGKILMGICAVLILLVGLSRIYLGDHWFSDTLGSYLIGTFWLYLMVLLHRKLTQTNIKS